jgi:hypothetical protein
MTLHFSHIGLTEARTFIAPFGTVSKRGPARSPGNGSTPTDKSSRPQAEAAAGAELVAGTSSCHGVRIRGPSAVIATVCPKWAASEPSWE